MFGRGRNRFRSQRVSQPFAQVPIGKEVEPEEIGAVGEGPPGFGEVVEPAEDEQGDECCPNLDVEGVFAGPDEGFDFEVLLEGLEEEFDLPPVFIDGGDGGGAEFEVVGEEYDLSLVFLIPDDDAAEEVWAFFRGVGSGEPDDFVGDDVGSLGRFEGLDDAVVGVFLQAGDEVDAPLGPVGEEFEVVEGHVHGDDGIGFEFEGSGGFDFVLSGGGDVDELGHVVAVVEEDIDLHSALGAAEFGPGEELKAEGDDGGVEGEELVFEAEAVFVVAEAAVVLEVFEGGPEEFLEELGGALFVGVGEGGAGDGTGDAEVSELAEAGLEPAGDLAEGLGGGELAEDHGNEVGPGSEALGVPFGLVFLDQGGELRAGEVVKNLTEETGDRYHNGVLLAVVEDGFLTIPSCHAKEDFSFSYFGH